jgi:hypothetical protein
MHKGYMNQLLILNIGSKRGKREKKGAQTKIIMKRRGLEAVGA